MHETILLDRLVVEERLERAEPDDRGDDLPRGLRLIPDLGERAAQRTLAVALDLLAHVAVGERAVGSQVDALPPNPLANPVGDDGDGCAHPCIMLQSGCRPPKLSTGLILPGRSWPNYSLSEPIRSTSATADHEYRGPGKKQ